MPRNVPDAVDVLEERLDELLQRMDALREENGEQKERISELEGRLSEQGEELERLRRKSAAAEKDLDRAYLDVRQQVQTRLNSLLARLESI
ncbi:MAG: cell division protein ZapB [bacterium]